MAIQYSVAQRTSLMTQLAADIGTSAQICIYSGSIPASVGTAPTGVLLAQMTGNASSFGTATNGVLVAGAITGATAVSSGTAGYFRINKSNGTAVIQGTIGTAGADMIISNTSINSSQPVTCSSLSITSYGA